MKQAYICPASRGVSMDIEGYLCYSKHEDEATQLSNRKDFGGEGSGWNSEGWNSSEE